MKTKIISMTVFLFLGLTMFSQSLEINSEEALVNFYFVKEKTSGSVKGITAKINFDVNDLSKSSIEGTADVSTLTTGNKMRDKHLQAEDMFNTAKFPVMIFKSTSIEKEGDRYIMKGKLTIKGTEQDASFKFTYLNGVFEGGTTIYTNDFNVFPKKKREDSQVNLKVNIPIK